MISKADNIAEYVLKIWQIEDLIRAFHDDEAMNQNAFMSEIRMMMEREGKMEKGHVTVSMVAVSEMQDLHEELYREDASYRGAWLQLMPAMTILKAKTDRPTMSDMEICLTFLYEIMLLRMQKKDISAATTATQQQVSQLLRHISMAYYADHHPIQDDNQAAI